MLHRFGFNTSMMLCEVVGACFELSAKKGYSSVSMAEQAMTSEWGVEVMTAVCFKEYSCANFMLEGYERYANLEKGNPIYDLDAMWYAGFFYKYWLLTRDMSPQEVYKIVPIDRIVKAFPKLYTQGWEYAIEEMTEGLKLDCEVFIPTIGYYGQDMR